MQNIENLKYPIGKLAIPENISNQELQTYIQVIAAFPHKLKSVTNSLTVQDLSLQYRPNSWTIRQLVHHCADSHLNSYIRFKLAITEDVPTVKPYDENLWADLLDTTQQPIEPALILLEGLHAKWAFLLSNLSNEQWNREFYHPENKNKVNLKVNACIYSWHCEHHLAHIELAKKSI